MVPPPTWVCGTISRSERQQPLEILLAVVRSKEKGADDSVIVQLLNDTLLNKRISTTGKEVVELSMKVNSGNSLKMIAFQREFKIQTQRSIKGMKDKAGNQSMYSKATIPMSRRSESLF